MSGYQQTLCLPRTTFPMKGDHLERQPEYLSRWRSMDLYRTILEDRRDGQPFVVHDGPPYASGEMHVGIGLNKVLKDVICRYHAMNDRRVPFVPGYDCHGLPIEREVTRELGPGARSLPAVELRSRCRERALRYVDEQRHLFQLLGVLADWDRPYLTLERGYEAGVLDVFLEFVVKGYVKRELRPGAWCWSCQTTLAEAELDHAPRTAPTLLVRFDVVAGMEQSSSLLVRFSSIWSLPATVAVGIDTNATYRVLRRKDQPDPPGLLVHQEAADAVLGALGDSYAAGETVAGEALACLSLRHPWSQEPIPTLAHRHAHGPVGTGCVPVVPANSPEDLTLALEHGLRAPSPLDPDGRFNADAGALEGLALASGESAIQETLSRWGTLIAIEATEHTAWPHCERCKRPVVARLTHQWFVSLDHREPGAGSSLRERAIQEVDHLRWTPAASRERMVSMLRDRPDWCISRQRVWGVPVPAFHCHSCRHAVLDPAIVERVRDLVSAHGTDVWFREGARDLLPKGYACPACGGTAFEKDPSVLDVWFESGSSWRGLLVPDPRLTFPADLVAEGTDQHRGWFQLSLLTALVARGSAPYRAVLTHGFVLNERMQRMDRSHGDLVTLREALEKRPADLLRLYFCSRDLKQDMSFSWDLLSPVESTYLSLRNTLRFLLGNLGDFRPREDAIHTDDLLVPDLYFLCRLHRLVSAVTASYEAFDLQSVVRQLEAFSRDDLSATYFEIVKDRLYCSDARSYSRRSAQTVFHSILVALTKLLAPILPYTTEEAFSHVAERGDCASVHLGRWPRCDADLLNRPRSQAAAVYARALLLRTRLGPMLEALRERKVIREAADARLELHSAAGVPELFGGLDAATLREGLGVGEVVAATTSEGLDEVEGIPGLCAGARESTLRICERCRRRDASTGTSSLHPDLCRRCLEAISPRLAELPVRSGRLHPGDRPVEVAAFLRGRGLRRVAFLCEDGKVVPFGEDPSIGRARPIEELSALASYIQGSPDLRRHAAVLLGLGEHTEALFGIGIHGATHGTPLGGTREASYATIRMLLDNLLRLSWGMSVKNAIGELPHGGGKSIIDPCGRDLKIHRELRRRVYRDFGQFTASLFGRYICAEDVGNTTADTRDMLSTCRHVMCLSQGVGGSGNPSRFTAAAAWAAAKAGWRFLTGSTSFAGLTIAIQGVGNVGRNLIDLLAESDPGIGRVVVSDRDPAQIALVRRRLRRRGSVLGLEVVSSRDPVERLSAPDTYLEREDEAGRDYVLYTPCDILVPVAVGNVLHPGNVDQLLCRVIVPIANNVYSDNDAVAEALAARGIVDVVENNVNWGGAMAAASELLGYDEDNVLHACLEAFRKTTLLLENARHQGRKPWELVKETVDRRISETHPITSAARAYPFIGDVSRDLNRWIKEKWLCHRVDVDPERFAAHAVAMARETFEELGSSETEGPK